MNIEYIAQPNTQIGRLIAHLLETEPKRMVLVSAFVGLQTIMRIEEQVLNLKGKGADIRFIIGIDLGGTSRGY
jgi:hypothetical protein